MADALMGSPVAVPRLIVVAADELSPPTLSSPDVDVENPVSELKVDDANVNVDDSNETENVLVAVSVAKESVGVAVSLAVESKLKLAEKDSESVAEDSVAENVVVAPSVNVVSIGSTVPNKSLEVADAVSPKDEVASASAVLEASAVIVTVLTATVTVIVGTATLSVPDRTVNELVTESVGWDALSKVDEPRRRVVVRRVDPITLIWRS